MKLNIQRMKNRKKKKADRGLDRNYSPYKRELHA